MDGFLSEFGLTSLPAMFKNQKPLADAEKAAVQAENSAAAKPLGIDHQNAAAAQLKGPGRLDVSNQGPRKLRGLIQNAMNHTLPQVPTTQRQQVFNWLQTAQHCLINHNPKGAAQALNQANQLAGRAIKFQGYVSENLETSRNLLATIPKSRRGVLTQALNTAEKALKAGDPGTAQTLIGSAQATIESILQTTQSFERQVRRVETMHANYVQNDLLSPGQSEEIQQLLAQARNASLDNDQGLELLQMAEEQISDYASNNIMLDDLDDDLESLSARLDDNDSRIPYDVDDSVQNEPLVSKEDAEMLRNKYFFRV